MNIPSRPAPTVDVPPPHPLDNPIDFPLAFKKWVIDYVTQELQVQRVFGFQAVPVSVTGIIPDTGTTPDAGTGFTYTHTNTSGIYVFTFTKPFAATPAVFTQPTGSSGDVNISDSSVSTTGFTVRTFSAAGALTDLAFNFVALTVQ